jgi:LacI family transcriptional regulator
VSANRCRPSRYEGPKLPTNTTSAATYKDIQRLTGLSLATISKYYNGRNVRASNRAAIESAAAELNYRPNAFASSFRRGVTRTVGLLLPSFQVPFHLEVVVGIEKYLRSQGIGVLVTCNEQDGTPSSVNAVELLLSRRVDGIIGVPALSDSSALATAVSIGIPVVTVDWRPSGLDADSVSLDNMRAGKVATQHLIDHGHRTLGALVGEEGMWSLQGRLDGFLAAARAADITIAEDHIQRGPLKVDYGYAAMMRLLAADTRPTAVFAGNYDLTVGAIAALNDSGLRLGHDISLVGFDAVELAQVTRPKLTVYVQPVEEIATEAARIMNARLDNLDESTSRVVLELPGHLQIGASVRRLSD